MQKAFKAFIVLLFFSFLVHSQNGKVDSLYALVKADKEDTSKVKHLCQIVYELKSSDGAKAIEAAEEALPIARKLNDKKTEAEILNWEGWAALNRGTPEETRALFTKAKEVATSIGYLEHEARALHGLSMVCYRLGEYQQGVRLLDECAKIPESAIKDKHFPANMHNTYGNCLNGMGNFKDAINHLLKALKIFTQIDDKRGIAAVLNNLGTNYQKQQFYQDALDNFEKALKINIETGNKDWQANNYVNMGVVYANLSEYPARRKQMRGQSKTTQDYTDLALRNYSVAMEIKKGIGEPNGVAHILNNIAVIEMYQAKVKKSLGNLKDFEELNNKALAELQEVVKIRQKTGDKDGLAKAYSNMGIIHYSLKHYSQAKDYLQKTLALAREIGNKEQIRDVYGYQSLVDSATNNFKSAYTYFRLYSSYNDSVLSDEDSRKALQMRMNYDFEMKRASDSLKNAEQATHERIKHEQELKHQRVYTYGGLIGFVLMMVVAILAIKAYRQKQSANTIISLQKQIVEVKQKAILDSIYYAQRIQNSLLPNDKYIERKLDNLKSGKDKNIKSS
jgi:tetratricopeptide (TPR) repeat protein